MSEQVLPAHLGKYTLTEILKTAGLTKTYKANTDQQDIVIIKEFAPQKSLGREAFDRFKDAMSAVKELDHPRIVRLIDIFEESGKIYIVRAYVEGISLENHLQGSPLSWDKAIENLQQIAEALEYAHRLGFIHRNLHPANIVIHPTHGAMITDFGWIRALKVSGLGDENDSGLPLGRPNYQAPEIWGGANPSPAADIFSLACLFFEMIANIKLFLTEDIEGARKQILAPLRQPKPWPSTAPQALWPVLQKALARQPHERYQSPQEFAWMVQQSQVPQGFGARLIKFMRDKLTFLRGKSRHLQTITQERLITLAPGVTMTFVYIPAGEFSMGSDPKFDQYARPDEQPQHEVSLDSFWMARYPVTNRQYAAFVTATRYRKPEHWQGNSFPANRANNPVVYVSWEDAQEFCKWVKASCGEQTRLPSEAEWEMAGRGKDRRIYPWGNRPPDRRLANFNQLFEGTTPAGKFSPQGDSFYQCGDMSGNVWEWVQDRYGESYYAASPKENPPGSPKGDRRVARGGSWLCRPQEVRVTARYAGSPSERNHQIGFRCACSDWR